jgi:hypothetical protein
MKSGYINIKLAEDDPLFPFAHNGWMTEHKIVMSHLIGRPLRRGENVHHRNGRRADNRPENLELWWTPQPPGQRMVEAIHCLTCTCSTPTQ